MMSKVQPIDTSSSSSPVASATDQAKPPAPATKSRLKRLFERPFHGVLRNSSSERLAGATDFEPSSVCLDKMVRNFMEDSGAGPEKPSRCGRSRCNCFNGNDSSSDTDDDLADHPVDASDSIKGLVVCTTIAERNLLADASSIVDKSQHIKRKDDLRKAVAVGLRSLGHDASICKSRWERAHSIPAGDYEYIDVMVNGERVLVDVDFRSEFEVARSTKGYRAVLQCLPCVFVGKEDRLSQIVGAVSEAARLSLKKRGLDVPPWRKPEYMRAKWLSACYSRLTAGTEPEDEGFVAPAKPLEPKRKPSSAGAKVVTGFALLPTS